jgi:hypothetical protein
MFSGTARFIIAAVCGLLSIRYMGGGLIFIFVLIGLGMVFFERRQLGCRKISYFAIAPKIGKSIFLIGAFLIALFLPAGTLDCRQFSAAQPYINWASRILNSCLDTSAEGYARKIII